MVHPPESNDSPSTDNSAQIEQDVKGDRNQVIGQANYSNVVNAGDNATINLPPIPTEKLDSSTIPNNLPRSGAIAFVGRDDLLKNLDDQLQNNERIGITGVRGMGGIGKTELALQYATYNLPIYPGGVCWLQARDQQIATQIVSFARANLGIKPPDELEADEQVRFTWQRWPEGNALIILDDVTDYDAIAASLPPSDPRFKVLITTRINLGSSVKAIEIEELTDESAIALLKSIVGDERIETQIVDAEKLCEWVGNLPLGLELLGRFLARKADWAIAKLLERLESKRLDAKALVSSESGMTASLGVAAALDLSWTELDEEEKDLGCLLGMFAVAPIPWNLVEQCIEELSKPHQKSLFTQLTSFLFRKKESQQLSSQLNLEKLEDCRDGLRDRSLIKRVDEGIYQIHQIVQEFFREKLKEKGDDAIALKQSFGWVMVAQAQILDATPTLDQIEQVRGAIAHLEETANQWLSVLDQEDVIWPFVGIGRFHQGQGNYSLAEPWWSKSYEDLRNVLGEEHPDVATSLNNLARLYSDQGRYDEALPLYEDALDLRKRVLGNEHPDVASSLNNLAGLYSDQGRYDEALPLYEDALDLWKRVLGEEHPDVASSYWNLGVLYHDQGQHQKAKSLYLPALEIYRKRLGNDHPNTQNLLSWLNAIPDHIEPLPLEDLGL